MFASVVSRARSAGGSVGVIAAAAVALAAAPLTLGGCSDAETSVLVHVRAEADVPAPALLRLRVVDAARTIVVDDTRLPDSGAPELPSTVVLYPRDALPLGLWLRAFDGQSDTPTGQAAATVTPVQGEQVEVTLTLRTAAPAGGDSDGDGVPDAVDRCPGVADPPSATTPCPGGGDDGGSDDGGSDGGGGGRDGGDGGSVDDAAPDATRDAGDAGRDGPAPPPDIAPGEPPPCTRRSDCDDNNPCTVDRCSDAGTCAYAPVTCPTPTNPCRVARCDPTQGCVQDNAPVTKSCNDGAYCTVNDHCDGNGACTGDPRVCNAATCRVASCNETLDRCESKTAPDGDSCSDGDACTQGETCSSGTCTPPPSPAFSTITTGENVAYLGKRALAIDSQGGLHAVFANTNTTSLRYAWRAAGSATWTVRTVAHGGRGDTTHASIAIDGADRVHIAFVDAVSDQARYGRLPSQSTGWTFETIGASDGYTAIATQGGRVHVVYGHGRALRYASRSVTSNGAWTNVQVEAAPTNTGRRLMMPSIVVASSGQLHVAYGQGPTTPTFADARAFELHYAVGTAAGGFAVTQPSQLSERHGSWPSIALAGNVLAIAHVRYNSSTPNQSELHLLGRVGTGAWSERRVIGGGVSFNSLVVNNSGDAHLVYRRFGTTPDELGYSLVGSSSAAQKVLRSGTQVGRWVQLVRASDGQLHGLHENENSRLVEHFTLSACP